ncbi:uncharacterized protein TRUGW13939_01978 [Talaromyces rugulosus]|uniref:Uncharacterized protein n=1 Tax=Talaromyces rugulosus TaxID=121627 RepID=A0A7H8QM04_TALRU|nr:uncharacterized protein TRUGW13939_01978 [Talaromyces rugulosus]QKX54888.1 hypothetical protein TRUGW13939_01978 [Talaromyces rugulosus]
MCRSSLALYTWCHCQESQLVEPCHSGEVSPSGSCDSMASETIQLHCYCSYHAEKGFRSAHKDQKKLRRADKKEKRRSFGSGSTTSVESFNSDASASSAASATSSTMRALPLRLKKGWNTLRRLSFDQH